MTRKEAERIIRQVMTLTALGFTSSEAESLRRISMTLHRWHELECGTDGGCIERDEKTDKPYWRRATGNHGAKEYPMPDREKGALKRLAVIIHARNVRTAPAQRLHGEGVPPHAVSSYIQTDPRGAALYILRPGDVPAGQDPGAYYSRGICVY